ncbi:outer membrane protein transport protein [Marinobacter sp. AC-23]|uniref:outer membrane protein transport protein n=1 Tax=Marinobacter sp. AC-23 TaxID=1879031 RepID=UPI000AB19677|nr:outer membrane protein transport protein [Marinobacter sp. AC-23]
MGHNSHKRQLLAAMVATTLSCGAQAQLAQNLTIHPKALALGNAVTADPPGIMAIHYNPAGLTKLEGRQFEVNLMSIYLDIDADFTAPEGYEIFGIDGLEIDQVRASSEIQLQTPTATPTTLRCMSPVLESCGCRPGQLWRLPRGSVSTRQAQS